MHAPGQHRRLPSGRRNFIALQLFQNLIQPIDAMQFRPRTEMLPAAQEAHEVGRTHWFDLAPQPPQRLPVNARQNAPMTKLMIPAGEIPAQNLPFAFELRQRDLHIAARSGPGAPPCQQP